jgi:hypothetical protein
MKKQKTRKTRRSSPVMPGFDYGLENSVAVVTAPDFNNNLREANIIACAYGMKHSHEFDATIPIISLVATKPDLMKQAFIQFKGWIDATGPDALQVEILFSGEGYYIGLGPNYKHLLWRTVGLDQTVVPLIFGLTYIKTIDTRNPFLDQLANQLPVAPIIVTGAHYVGTAQPPRAPSPHAMQPIPGCPELLLFQLPVYRTAAEVPRESGLIACTKATSKPDLGNSRQKYVERTRSPDEVFYRRERRITSLMPITIHMLRTFAPLRDRIRALQGSGFEQWQLEQAFVNQRFWAQCSPKERARLPNPKELPHVISNFVELYSPNWQDVATDEETILQQAHRDQRILLRALGLRPHETTSDCQSELAKRGYLHPGSIP